MKIKSRVSATVVNLINFMLSVLMLSALMISALIMHVIFVTQAHAAKQATVREVFTLSDHKGSVSSVAFSPDGKNIISGSDDATIKIWDVTSGKSIRTIELPSPVTDIAYSPDGKIIASGIVKNADSSSPKAQLWDASSGEKIADFAKVNTSVRFVTFSPDGKHIIIGAEKATPIIWDVKTLEMVNSFDAPRETATDAAYSPDGKLIIMSALYQMFSIFFADGNVENTLPLLTYSTYAVAFAPDGHSYAYVGKSNNLEINPTGRFFMDDNPEAKMADENFGWEGSRKYVGHTAFINSAAFSPDGKYVIGGSDDKTAIIWRANKQAKQVATLKGHSDAINSVAFSPNGKLVITGSKDGTVKVWALDF